MIIKIAHRGMSCAFPENTVLAIQSAIQSNADYVEVDIRLSKDRIPVVFHDESLERTSKRKCSQLIEHLTFEELRQHDAGSWHHEKYRDLKIPSLAEVLTLDWKNKGLMLEIKQGEYSPEEIVAIVTRTLQEHQIPEKILIGSFSHQILTEVLKLNFSPKNIIGILENLQFLPFFQAIGVTLYALWHPLINKELIQFMHALKYKVWCFTVDDPKEIQRLAALGVDGIISNRDFELIITSRNG